VPLSRACNLTRVSFSFHSSASTASAVTSTGSPWRKDSGKKLGVCLPSVADTKVRDSPWSRRTPAQSEARDVGASGLGHWSELPRPDVRASDARKVSMAFASNEAFNKLAHTPSLWSGKGRQASPSLPNDLEALAAPEDMESTELGLESPEGKSASGSGKKTMLAWRDAMAGSMRPAIENSAPRSTFEEHF